MPYQISDYSKGLIYKLCCLDTDITDIYIGSTTNFKQRKSGHKRNCNNEKSRDYNYDVYKCIRENGDWGNWDMVLVEYYSCETKLELEKREREIIEKLKPTLNKIIPTRTRKEYREENKEKIARTDKEYREENKEKISKRTKIYRQENKEKLKIMKKEYYEEHKEEIKEKRKEKITCDCGSILGINDKAKHLKTIKHKNYINLLE
jgi:hypothetical protein